MSLAKPGACPDAESWAASELASWGKSIVRSCAEAEAAVGATTLHCLGTPASASTCWPSEMDALLATSPREAGPIVLTSTLPGEGKTTTVLALAIHSACAGRKTLLVDTDCRFAGLPRLRVDVEPSPGLREASRGARPVETLIQKNIEPGLDVLPCGLALSGRQPDFQKLAATLLRASDGYDAVFVDSTPFLPVPDTFSLLNALPTSRLIVLCEAGRATTFGLHTLRERAAQTGAQTVGLIVTRVASADERLETARSWSARVLGSALSSDGSRAAVGACFYPPGTRDGMDQWWILERDNGGWKPVAQVPELTSELLEKP